METQGLEIQLVTIFARSAADYNKACSEKLTLKIAVSFACLFVINSSFYVFLRDNTCLLLLYILIHILVLKMTPY